MQVDIDRYNTTKTVPQIWKDRLGRYYFMPVRIGMTDCCGFVYRIIGKHKK